MAVLARIRNAGTPARVLLPGTIVALALVVSGCGGKGRGRGKPVAAAPGAAKPVPPPVHLRMKSGTFIVDDEKGNRLMEATAEKTQGFVATEGSNQGPIIFTKAHCKMYRAGKLDMVLSAPTAAWENGKLVAGQGARVENADGTVKADAKQAIWENSVVTMHQVDALLFRDGQPRNRVTAPEAILRGDELVAEKTVHSETLDRTTQVDAQRAVWNRAQGHLRLEKAVGQKRRGGRPVFSASGPVVQMDRDIITIPSSAAVHRQEDGAWMRADRIVWNQATGALQATGNVQMDTPEMRAHAARMTGNTTLKKGRLTGRPRPRIFVKRRPA